MEKKYFDCEIDKKTKEKNNKGHCEREIMVYNINRWGVKIIEYR